MDEIGQKPVPPEKAPDAKACKVCGESLRGARTAVLCARCRTPHHLDCWRFNKGCSVYGCGCRTWESPPASADLPGPLRFERIWPQAPRRILGVVAFLPAFFLAFGGLVSMMEHLPTTAAVFCLLATLSGLVFFRYGLVREWLFVDPEHGRLNRSLQLAGMVLRRDDDWLAVRDVVELQFHLVEFAPGGVSFRLYALLTTGERRLLLRDVGGNADKAKQVERLVDDLAVFFDCTVRQIRGAEPPSAWEIEEAVAQRRLAALGGTKAAGSAKPAAGPEGVPPTRPPA